MKNKPIQVVAAILQSGSKVLIGKRMVGDTNAGKWEFPGGKIKPGEEAEAALRREIMEELGIELGHLVLFAQVQHDYPAYSVHIEFYLTKVDASIQLEQKSHDELQWIELEQSRNFDFLEANRVVIEKLSQLNH